MSESAKGKPRLFKVPNIVSAESKSVHSIGRTMQRERMKRQNYRICGCTIYHYGSLSSSQIEFNPIAKVDAKIYKKLTVKWYHRLFSYEEIWDCHKYRLLGMTLKIKKKKPWGKRYA